MKHRIRILTHDFSDLFNGEQHTRFIVGPKERDQRRIGANRLGQLIQVQMPLRIHRQPGNLIAPPREMFAELKGALGSGERSLRPLTRRIGSDPRGTAGEDKILRQWEGRLYGAFAEDATDEGDGAERRDQ